MLMVELPGDDELVVTCFDTIVNVVEVSSLSPLSLLSLSLTHDKYKY